MTNGCEETDLGTETGLNDLVPDSAPEVCYLLPSLPIRSLSLAFLFTGSRFTFAGRGVYLIEWVLNEMTGTLASLVIRALL